ncbi:MAG TPA: hypothetical protein VE595_00770 [Nitrososphaeraceae archaeon]|nr:hypothetical protein [Nitrososphaeraceae archaeon]
MKFLYSLLAYGISIFITISLITIIVSAQSNSDELKIYTYSQGKFIVDYPSNYMVESQDNMIETNKIKSSTSKLL